MQMVDDASEPEPNGGAILLMLPEETLHKVLEWLPVDTYATLALVSRQWKHITRTEDAYKRICQRVFFHQLLSPQRALRGVAGSRFHNSYRTMLERRPWLRRGGGVYVLQCTRVKRVERDMWTEIPAGEVLLEMVHYRYLYFREEGRVLYALTPKPPSIMIPALRRMCLARQFGAKVTWGTYELQKKNCVVVTARQSWQHVQLHMTMVKQKGNSCCLSLEKHFTSFTGDFSDQVSHRVPEECFQFVKDVLL